MKAADVFRINPVSFAEVYGWLQLVVKVAAIEQKKSHRTSCPLVEIRNQYQERDEDRPGRTHG